MSAAMEIVIEADREPGVFDYSAQAGPEGVSLSNAVSMFPNVNLSSKGFPGVQSDAFIGGGTFEQAAVYLDGIPMNDPQTGHFNLDIPVPQAALSGVKIINNAGAFAGAGALSGMAEFITAVPQKDFFTVGQLFSSYDTFETSAQAAKKIDDYFLYLAGSTAGSAGYREGTDYYRHNAFVKALLPDNITLTGGYEEKNFGAYDFYTPGAGLPSREHVITRFASLASEPLRGLKITVFGRSHYDKFILDNDNPSYYMNMHSNAVYGLNASYIMEFEGNVFKYTLRPVREEIQSSNLGNRYRMKAFGSAAWFAEPVEGLKINANAGAQFLEASEMPEFLPAINITARHCDIISSFAGWGMSSRQPNFTELYYNDPKNEGNPGLKPEHSQQVNAGYKFEGEGFKAKLEVFYRYGTDMIDWGKDSPADLKWKIRNTGISQTYGGSLYAEYGSDLLRAAGAYAYTQSENSADYISKYGMLYLKNKLSLSVKIGDEKLGGSAGYLYKDYFGRNDAPHNVTFSFHYIPVEGVKVSAAAENALNWYFEETKGVPAPGRMITLGMEYSYR